MASKKREAPGEDEPNMEEKQNFDDASTSSEQKPKTRVELNPADCDLDFNIEDNGLQGSGLYEEEGFAYCWSGARANMGISGGKYCFSCKIISEQPVQMEDTTPDQQHLCVVGVSRGDDRLGNLGETKHSFGFGSTGESSTCGEKFGIGDTIVCAVNLEEKPFAFVSFSKDGKWLGSAKEFNAGGLGLENSRTRKSALFPHVLLKNVVAKLQFSVEDGLRLEEGFKPWASAEDMELGVPHDVVNSMLAKFDLPIRRDWSGSDGYFDKVFFTELGCAICKKHFKRKKKKKHAVEAAPDLNSKNTSSSYQGNSVSSEDGNVTYSSIYPSQFNTCQMPNQGTGLYGNTRPLSGAYQGYQSFPSTSTATPYGTYSYYGSSSHRHDGGYPGSYDYYNPWGTTYLYQSFRNAGTSIQAYNAPPAHYSHVGDSRGCHLDPRAPAFTPNPYPPRNVSSGDVNVIYSSIPPSQFYTYQMPNHGTELYSEAYQGYKSFPSTSAATPYGTYPSYGSSSQRHDSGYPGSYSNPWGTTHLYQSYRNARTSIQAYNAPPTHYSHLGDSRGGQQAPRAPAIAPTPSLPTNDLPSETQVDRPQDGNVPQ